MAPQKRYVVAASKTVNQIEMRKLKKLQAESGKNERDINKWLESKDSGLGLLGAIQIFLR